MQEFTVNGEAQVLKSVETYVERWNERVRLFPLLKLDYSWPSLGILDHITFPLRYKLNLSVEEKNLLSFASGYMSYVISKLTKEKYPCYVKTNSDEQIVISIGIGSRKFEIEIENILETFFRDLNGTLPLLPEYTRPIAYDTPVLSALTLSFALGSSPFLAKELREEANKLKPENVQYFEREIAKDIAYWFENNFPQEKITHIPELYLKGMVWPFLLMEEGPPLLSTVVDLDAYRKSMGLPKQYLGGLIKAFSLCPDEQVSATSIGMAGIFQGQKELPISVIANALSRKYLTPLVRESLIFSAKIEQEIEDWLETGLNAHNHKLFELERELGSLPWISLPKDWFKNSENFEFIKPFLKDVRNFNFQAGLRFLEDEVEKNPAELDLRVQRIKFEFISGDFEKCHELCKRLISEPEADKKPEFFNIWGLCLLSLNEPEVASRYFRAAKAIKHEDLTLKSEILNNLAWSNIQLGSFEKAKEDLLVAEGISPCPVTIWLNLAFVFANLKEQEQYEKYLKLAIQAAPFDKRVFSSI